MSARKQAMIRKANALFDHNPNYTFRQLMVSYRFRKSYTKKHGMMYVCDVSEYKPRHTTINEEQFNKLKEKYGL